MYDLVKVSQLEKASGLKVKQVIKEVPLTNVVTAVKTISLPDLIDLATAVSPLKLIQGLKIIRPDQIKDVPVSKLKIANFFLIDFVIFV